MGRPVSRPAACRLGPAAFAMDPFHGQLARVGLDAAGSFGFARAGGYAVQAHGFLTRMSADVDLLPGLAGSLISRRQRGAPGAGRGPDSNLRAEEVAGLALADPLTAVRRDAAKLRSLVLVGSSVTGLSMTWNPARYNGGSR